MPAAGTSAWTSWPSASTGCRRRGRTVTRRCRGSRSTRRTSTPACPRGPRSPTPSSADRDPGFGAERRVRAGAGLPARAHHLRDLRGVLAEDPDGGRPGSPRRSTPRPKHVASRTLISVDWDTALLIEGDVVEAVRALKAEDGGELQVHGSAGLIQTLLEPS